MIMRYVIVAAVAGLIGFVAGNAFWYLVSPMWIDVEVSESITPAETVSVLARGGFADADRSHKGKGIATIFQGVTGERILRFTDFEVTNGPDLQVWLVAAPNPTSSADVTNGEWVSLGRLKGNIGEQNYDIAGDVDLSKVGSVVIWCEQFSALFSAAPLER